VELLIQGVIDPSPRGSTQRPPFRRISDGNRETEGGECDDDQDEHQGRQFPRLLGPRRPTPPTMKGGDG
jgi:hypothetical protein